MKLFRERFDGAFVAQPFEPRAFHDVGGYPDERTVGILVGHRICGEHGRNARQHLHYAKWVGERARNQAGLAARDVQRAELLPIFTDHADLGGRLDKDGARCGAAVRSGARLRLAAGCPIR